MTKRNRKNGKKEVEDEVSRAVRNHLLTALARDERNAQRWLRQNLTLRVAGLTEKQKAALTKEELFAEFDRRGMEF